MKVLLISPCPHINTMSTTQYPPLGLLYIGSSIRDIVDELMILDANILQLSNDEIIHKIEDYSPDLVGISINIVTAQSAREIVSEIKKQHPHIITVAGGPLPTVYPAKWLNFFDVVIAGEGEVAFRNIIEQLNEGQVLKPKCRGICLRGEEISCADHPDLNTLPFPAYDCLVPNLEYYSQKARVAKKFMAPLLTSRGCPYSCSFCDKSVHGKNFRRRSVESVLEEVKWLYTTYGIRQLDILDDNFTFDKARANAILDGIIEIGKFKINCQNGIRADRIDEQLAIKMKKAGVFRVGIGIESGNPLILEQLNKNLNLDDVINAINIFRKLRITTQGYFIIGLPFEKFSDINDTIQFAIKANPHYANFAHYLPIVGTDLYNELEEKKMLVNEDEEVEASFFRSTSYIKNQNINENDMKKIYGYAWKAFYFRLSKVIDIISTVNSLNEFMWIVRVSLSMLKSKIVSGRN